MTRLRRRERLAWLLRQRGHTYGAIAARLARFEGRATPMTQQNARHIVQRVERIMRQRERNPRWHDGLRTETVTRLARAGYDTPEAIREGLRRGVIRPGFTDRFGPRAYAEVVEVFGAGEGALTAGKPARG